jgi:hypothetical protein
MTEPRAHVEIASRDYWFKMVDFLQQNWALLDRTSSGVRVWFIAENSGVFDGMDFVDESEAVKALGRNGFKRFAEDRQAPSFILPPRPPFSRYEHPNGPIYSSGRFWI